MGKYAMHGALFFKRLRSALVPRGKVFLTKTPTIFTVGVFDCLIVSKFIDRLSFLY